MASRTWPRKSFTTSALALPVAASMASWTMRHPALSRDKCQAMPLSWAKAAEAVSPPALKRADRSSSLCSNSCAMRSASRCLAASAWRCAGGARGFRRLRTTIDGAVLQLELATDCCSTSRLPQASGSILAASMSGGSESCFVAAGSSDNCTGHSSPSACLNVTPSVSAAQQSDQLGVQPGSTCMFGASHIGTAARPDGTERPSCMVETACMLTGTACRQLSAPHISHAGTGAGHAHTAA
mmetsp:Transcript_4849/g.8423  ORF Transcript_4849/g.8423 Transcript_4849/m.8423 type:complete len:240 (+) Transcript_4849:819-1538(+)